MGDLTNVVLTPAYGRDYKSRKAIIEDLNAGKDFTANSPNGAGYCSVRDLADGSFQVRYKQIRSVATVKILNGVAS